MNFANRQIPHALQVEMKYAKVTASRQVRLRLLVRVSNLLGLRGGRHAQDERGLPLRHLHGQGQVRNGKYSLSVSNLYLYLAVESAAVEL
jgi:hypothetical protein